MNLNLKYLPALIVLTLPMTLIVTFAFAFYYKHVTYFVPYISDSGTFPPESCIFGQILNIISLLLVFAMYVKYRQVQELYIRFEFTSKKHLNKKSFYFGLLAALGVSLVANFQETTMLTTHWLGAILAFGCGSIYQCLQTWQYFILYPIIGQAKINILRAILSLLSLISFMICFICGMVSYSQFKGTEMTKWKLEDGGFKIHVISSVAEWICASCTMGFVFCFTWDFKNITIHEPDVFVKEDVTYSVNIES